MKTSYLNMIHLLERLHRQFLELVKSELDRLNIGDINNIQSLILFSIGEDEITIGELTYRGYYLGSNVSYNVKNMVEAGYLEQQRSAHDKRSVRVKLTDKGLNLKQTLDKIFDEQVNNLAESDVKDQDLENFMNFGSRMERFWLRLLNFSWRPPSM
jgi:DNA-binding MarR family transcriptional regulator